MREVKVHVIQSVDNSDRAEIAVYADEDGSLWIEKHSGGFSVGVEPTWYQCFSNFKTTDLIKAIRAATKSD